MLCISFGCCAIFIFIPLKKLYIYILCVGLPSFNDVVFYLIYYVIFCNLYLTNLTLILSSSKSSQAFHVMIAVSLP